MSSNSALERSGGVSPPGPEPEPVLPAKAREDTDVGWGEPPQLDDEDRLNRDRPPHWDLS